jgi:hypothetical protein
MSIGVFSVFCCVNRHFLSFKRLALSPRDQVAGSIKQSHATPTLADVIMGCLVSDPKGWALLLTLWGALTNGTPEIVFGAKPRVA